jgi:hypothetical protein
MNDATISSTEAEPEGVVLEISSDDPVVTQVDG